MTSCCRLLLGMLLWWTPASLASPAQRTQSLAQHYASVRWYPFSRVVGVLTVVDENSCVCLPVASPCPLEITESSTLKTRGLPCPLQTRYCCWRKLLRNLFSNPSTDSAERQQLSSNVSHTPTTIPAERQQLSTNVSHTPTTIPAERQQLSTNVSHTPTTIPAERQGHSGSISQQVMTIPAQRQRYDTKFQSHREAVDNPRTDRSFWQPSAFNTTFAVSRDPGRQSGQVRDTNSSNDSEATVSEASTSNTPLGAEEHPSDVFRPARSEKDFQRRPKTAACSCMTQADCIHSWSHFRDLPEAEIKTSLECEGSDEFTCCLGRVMPARSRNSPEQRRRGRPTPASSVWDSLVSWFIG